MNNINIEKQLILLDLFLRRSYIKQFPLQLIDSLNGIKIHKKYQKTLIKQDFRGLVYNEIDILNEWNPIKGFVTYGLKNNLFDISEIKSWFEYETDEDRKEFEGLIDGLAIPQLKK